MKAFNTRNVFGSACLLGLVWAVSGCDVLDMPKKMDDTLEQIKLSNKQIKQSVDGIQVTNAAIHDQKLLLALTDVLDEKHSRYLTPPTGMLAGGEKFAEEATTEEFVKLAYVWLKEVDKMTPDESEKGQDGKYPAEVIARVDHQKLVKLTGLQIIAGLIQEYIPRDASGRPTCNTSYATVVDPLLQTCRASVEEVIEREINRGGRYEATAYAALMARAMFLTDLLIEPLLDEKITNIGKVKELVTRIALLDDLAKLPFAAKIALKTKRMLNPVNNIDVTLDLAGEKSPIFFWKKAAKAVERQLDPRYQNDESLPALKQKIESAIGAWTGVPR